MSYSDNGWVGRCSIGGAWYSLFSKTSPNLKQHWISKSGTSNPSGGGERGRRYWAGVRIDDRSPYAKLGPPAATNRALLVLSGRSAHATFSRPAWPARSASQRVSLARPNGPVGPEQTAAIRGCTSESPTPGHDTASPFCARKGSLPAEDSCLSL